MARHLERVRVNLFNIVSLSQQASRVRSDPDCCSQILIQGKLRKLVWASDHVSLNSPLGEQAHDDLHRSLYTLISMVFSWFHSENWFQKSKSEVASRSPGRGSPQNHRTPSERRFQEIRCCNSYFRVSIERRNRVLLYQILSSLSLRPLGTAVGEVLGREENRIQ